MTSTSYPFLAVARRLGLDYGRVLTYADYLWARDHPGWCSCTLRVTCRLCHASAWGLAQPPEVRHAIAAAYAREINRRNS